MGQSKEFQVSPQRLERRRSIAEAARALVGASVGGDFDAVRSGLCPVDVVMVAGAPWLRDAIERDFAKDASGYRKIGGGANTPAMAYFFRSTRNLMHYLKRQGLYVPWGARPSADVGMACFFDWEDRGRFNFVPDCSGIIVEVADGHVTKAVMAVRTGSERIPYEVKEIDVFGHPPEKALIGYSDLP